MKPTKQTVYLPTKEDYGMYLGNFLGYPEGYSNVGNLQEKQGYFFTPEQLNEYTQNVIKQTLETAAEKADTCIEKGFIDEYRVVDKKSITNTFDETYKKFEV